MSICLSMLDCEHTINSEDCNYCPCYIADVNDVDNNVNIYELTDIDQIRKLVAKEVNHDYHY